MDNLYVLRGQIQQFYAKNSKYINKALQFIIALLTFYMINHNMGFMKLLSNPLITVGLSVICAFLPMIVTVLAAAVLCLAQMAAVSIGITAVTAVVFLIMFIFYLRFSPKTALVLLLTPLAFMLKIPYVIPVAFGLVGTPVYAVPIIFGVMIYYMIDYLDKTASSLKGEEAEGMITQVTEYAKNVFQNKEMLVSVFAFVIVLFLVYNVRRMAINYAWKTAVASGAVAGIVIVFAGSMMLGIKTSYPELILGNVVAVIAGLILEFLFFSVDYSRCESVQYEDDEYYYYVKAVPKIAVSAPEKTVKRINKRGESQETEIIDTEEIRKKNAREHEVSGKDKQNTGAGKNRKEYMKEKEVSEGRKRAPKKKSSKIEGNTEHLLLTKVLQQELNLDDNNSEK